MIDPEVKRAISEARKRGKTVSELCKEYGVSKGTVYYAQYGRVYKRKPQLDPAGAGGPHGSFYVDAENVVRQVDKKAAPNRLSGQAASAIRERYAIEKITQRQLAAEYDVTVLTINQIITRKTWKEFP